MCGVSCIDRESEGVRCGRLHVFDLIVVTSDSLIVTKISTRCWP